MNFDQAYYLLCSRLLAAVFGGYALATSSALFIGQLLALLTDQYQAVHIGLMLSFLIYAATVIWVFSVSQIKALWLTLIKINLLLFGLSGLLLWVNGQ